MMMFVLSVYLNNIVTGIVMLFIIWCHCSPRQ